METKKASHADLERQRTTRFLMGLVVALALCFAALELTTRDSDDELEAEWLEDIAQDMERLPAIDRHDYVAAVENVKPQPQMTEQVREVTETTVAAASPAEERMAEPKLMPVEVPPQMTVDPTAVPAVPLDLNDNPLQLRVVEDAPKPEMGWTALMKWLTQNLKYPPAAKAQNIQGTVLVRFVVDADGSVADIRVARSADPLLDREALRVVRMMPKWEPGVKNGKPVRSLVGIPVVFKI